jgi:hypothetical protein
MKKIISGFCLLLQMTLSAQHHDRYWITGMNEFENTPGFGNVLIRFDQDSFSLLPTDIAMHFESTMASMSDSAGNLLFVTNGCHIVNRFGDTIPGGEVINPGEMHEWICGKTGYAVPKGAMALPDPGYTNKYYLLHMGARYDPVKKQILGPFYYSHLDMSTDNGIVTDANHILVNGKFEPFSAVRHGNGRDWWLVVPEADSNRYFIYLLDPQGISGPEVQEIGAVMRCTRPGTSAFSLQGDRFARAHNCSVQVFKFDRCSGILFDPLLMSLPSKTVGGGGVAFSPDGTKLFTCSHLNIYQADLTIDQPSLDTAIIWDTQWGISIRHMQNAPGGSIWLNHMHRAAYYSIINSPNEIGQNIQFLPKITMPVYSVRTLPNNPNYRLYDVPDAFCDSLGINAPTSSTYVLSEWQDIQIVPNPATNTISVSGIQNQTEWQVYSAEGRLINKGITDSSVFSIPVSQWPQGIYFLRIMKHNNVLIKKFIVTR